MSLWDKLRRDALNWRVLWAGVAAVSLFRVWVIKVGEWMQ